MKKIITFTVFLFITAILLSQEVRDHRRGNGGVKPVLSQPKPVTSVSYEVFLYVDANLNGTFDLITTDANGYANYLLSDLNDMITSVEVPSGLVVVLYEHGNESGGYGNYVELMEDCTDLSQYNLNDKISYISIFPAEKDGNYIWARGRLRNGVHTPGHWQRKRSRGSGPDNSPPAVVSFIDPPLNPSAPSVLSVGGSITTITSLGDQTSEGKSLWERAVNNQLGIIGNDYRGIEEIGSACFQRGSNNNFIPDNLNFWYPQKRKRDHRDKAYHKHTLTGTVREARQANISGTYKDYDVNIDIVPDPHCMYMLTENHRREYMGLMSTQWHASLHKSGQPDCNDAKSIAAFERVEAEIAESYWPKGNHTYGRARLADLTLIQTGKKMCVYGPWIYDKGHCCQPEIHPAEQLWWNNPIEDGKKYNLNVLCDASRRFWWRDQMDDGTKLRPWAAPPVKGLFAIAFEVSLGTETNINTTYKKFEVSYIDHYNLISYPNANQVYNLVYQGKPLVSFIPHNDAFKVSYEHVGRIPGTNKIRGFLVIETSVGKCTQIATTISTVNGGVVNIPAGISPEQVPQLYERQVFKKEEGFYLFSVLETTVGGGLLSN